MMKINAFTVVLFAVISVLCFHNVGAQTDACLSAAGSRRFIHHVNVSLAPGPDAEKYPGIFYYDLPEKQMRITYTPTDITVEEVTEWTFFTDGVTVRTCRGECSRFITDPAKNLFPVLIHRPDAFDPVNIDNGILANNTMCNVNSDGFIETSFKQVDNTLNPPEVELEISLTLSLIDGIKRATINYPKAENDGTLFLEFLNATNLIPPDFGGNFPPGTWDPPADCDASGNITVCKRLVDLAFILDGSSSIDEQEYETLISFVEAFIDPELNIITIDENISRAGIVTFESRGSIHTELTYDYDDLQASINNLIDFNLNRTGGKTNITGALDAATYMFKDGRDEVHRVAVLVTDGVHTTDGEPPQKMASVLKASGVTIIVVAVGDSLDQAQLQGIASDGAFFGTSQFEGIGKLVNELIPTLCDGEYEQPCDGCAGICFCLNRCVEPPPPTPSTPTSAPTDMPCIEEEPICCPDLSGTLHRFDCPTIHAGVDFEEVGENNETCLVLECPLPEDIPEMLNADGSISDDAQCRVMDGNGTCLVVIAPSGVIDPTTGLAVGVGSAVLVLAAIAFVAYRVIQGAAAGGAGAAGGAAAIGGAANTSPVFAPAANVNTSPLGA